MLEPVDICIKNWSKNVLFFYHLNAQYSAFVKECSNFKNKCSDLSILMFISGPFFQKYST